MNPEEVEVDCEHHVPHGGASGEEATIEPEVEPNYIERNREGKERSHYLATGLEGKDSEEVHHDHHVQDISSCLKYLNKGESFVRVVEVAGGWWENPRSTEDRHEENQTKNELRGDV